MRADEGWRGAPTRCLGLRLTSDLSISTRRWHALSRSAKLLALNRARYSSCSSRSSPLCPVVLSTGCAWRHIFEFDART